MKSFIKSYPILFVLAFVACQANEDNNEALEYDKLEVNFSAKTTGFDMPENVAYGIAAYCAKNNQDGVQINETKKISVYNSINGGSSSNLVKASDSDGIEASVSDHNFKFYAVYPYNADVDFRAVEAAVPAIQNYQDGVNTYLTFTAHTRVTSIIPTVAFEMTTPFVVLNLSVPLDIIEEGAPSTLKSITIAPANAGNFGGALAGGGTIDAETGVFTPDPDNTSASIRLDFPAEGLTLRDVKTIIPLAVLPFTVPEKGFEIVFEGIDGNSNTTSFLSQASDAGAVIKAGSVKDITITISHSDDGIVPVSFPVEFPLGKVDGVPRVTAALQPRWTTEGVWICKDQPQAYAQWYRVSDPSPDMDYKFRYEITNSGDISTPGIKGVWTGDYMEFTIPVKKINANTKVNWKIPFYGRFLPVFWYLKYLDGKEWKTVDLSEKTCYDGKTKKNCTFFMEHDVIKILDYTMTLSNEIKSGYMKFRLECADGSIQTAAGGKIEVNNRPWIDGSNQYQAPCYFRTDRGTALKEIVFTIE
jgi:hypothetical protein